MPWKEKIEKALLNDLPGPESHYKMIPPGRNLSPASGDRIRKSSVLLLLFEENGEIFTVLIKRPAHMKNHPGQIGFPGGTIESSDLSVEGAAIRESREELGIETGSIQVIGSLSELYISVSKFLIYPIVAWCNKKPLFSVNHHEVEKLLLFPVIFHLNNVVAEYELVKTSNGILSVPCYRYEGEIIWGATAMILSEFMDIIKCLPEFKPQEFAK